MRSALLVALLLCIRLPRTLADGSMRIPKILHRNFMAGADALREATRNPRSGFKAHWLDSCRTHNRDMQEVVWDAAAVLQLAQEDFPWLLPAYLAYPKLVQRSDIARCMILYKYGGVYLDADVECYAPLSPSLAGKDLVLNCEYPEAQVQLHNAVMASVPGHPFWLQVLKEALARAGTPPAGINPVLTGYGTKSGFIGVAAGVWGSAGSRVRQLLNKLQQLWEASPWHDNANAVLWSTGPMLLTTVYKRHIGRGAVCGRSANVAGRIAYAYELGSWFTPCLWNDETCQRKWVTQHMLLTRNSSRQTAASAQQQQQSAAGSRQQQAELHGSLVVGIHHYSGSWMDWDVSGKQHKEQQLQHETSQHVLYFFRDSPMFQEYNCSTPLQSSSSRRGSRRRHATPSLGSPIPLCMEFVLDALATNSCAVLTVLGPAPDAAAAAAEAGQDVSTEVLLHRLGCQVMTASPSRDPPPPLQALLSPLEGSNSSSTSSSSSSSSSSCSSCRGKVSDGSSSAAGAGSYRHMQVLLREQQAGCVDAAADVQLPEAVPLLSLLQQDPSDLLRQQQQQQEHQVDEQQRQQGEDVQQVKPLGQQEEPREQAANVQHTARASQQLQRRYVLRLSCGGCELPVLQQLFEAAGESSLLQRTQLLLLDMQLPAALPEAASSGDTELGRTQQDTAEGAMQGSAGGTAEAAASQRSTAATVTGAASDGQSCAAAGNRATSATASCGAERSSRAASTDSCKASSHCQAGSSSSSSGISLEALAAVYNLLHQQHGFVGFMRQRLPCGVVRLGWVRQPARMAARSAVLGSAADAQLLSRLRV